MNKRKTAWEQLSASWKRIAAVIAAVSTIVALICSVMPWEADKVTAVGILGGVLILFIGWAIDRQQEYVDEIMESHTREADKKSEELHDGIVALQKVADATRLDTLRIQLFQYMQYQPDNVDTILRFAETYFCGKGGNWVMEAEFLKWSKKQGIEVPPDILAAIRNSNKKLD